MGLDERVTRIERLLNYKRIDYVSVVLKNGDTVRMTLSDCIPLIKDGEIKSIDGEGQGLLKELLEGLMKEGKNGD